MNFPDTSVLYGLFVGVGIWPLVGLDHVECAGFEAYVVCKSCMAASSRGVFRAAVKGQLVAD